MVWKRWTSFLLFLIASAFMATSSRGQLTVPAQLTLRQAKNLLIRHSPLYQAEKLNSEAARGILTGVSKRPNPGLEIGSAGLGSSPDSGAFVDNQEFTATLSYRLEARGKRLKRIEVARSGVEIADSEFEDWVSRLTFELQQRYFQVVLAQREVEIAQEASQGFGRLVGLSRVRYENGEISGRELRRIEAEHYRFQEDVIEAEVELENAQDRLLALLGSEEFDAPFRAVDGFDPSFTPPSLQQLRQISLGHRKDLQAQRKRLDQAAASIALEKARASPDVNLFGGYRRDFGHDGAIIGVNFPLKVFDKNQGNISSALVRQRQERLRLQALQLRVAQEVQLALNQLRADRRRLQTILGGYLEKTRQARDISETAYRLGSVSLLEFLDAERAYREASRHYGRALYDFEASRARLELAAGRGLR